MFDNWASDPEVTKYVTWLPHQNIGITEMIVKEWIKEDKNPRTIRYMITIKGDNEPIGLLMLLIMSMVFQRLVIVYPKNTGIKDI